MSGFAHIMVEQMTWFTPKTFEQKSCFVFEIFKKSLALHPKCVNKCFPTFNAGLVSCTVHGYVESTGTILPWQHQASYHQVWNELSDNIPCGHSSANQLRDEASLER